jgi:hypothetical protein
MTSQVSLEKVLARDSVAELVAHTPLLFIGAMTYVQHRKVFDNNLTDL